MNKAPKQPKTAVKNTRKIKTEWDLTQIYKSLKDPQIEADVKAVEQAYLGFARKYTKDKAYLSNIDSFLKAVKEYTGLNELPSTKVMWYLYNYQFLESHNTAIAPLIGQYESRLTKAANEIVFFELEFGKFEAKKQKEILSDSRFEFYKKYLARVFELAKYTLSEEVEKVLNLKSRPAQSMWVDGSSKLTSAQSVMYKGKEMPISEAQSLIHQLPTKERRALNKIVMEKLKSISFFSENEINAIFTDKKIDDELRGQSKPYSATILRYENEEKTVESLVQTVVKNYKVSHDFHKLKAKLLKEKKLTYADRAVGVAPKQIKVSFDEAVEIIRTSFERAHPRFKEIFDRMLSNGQIDVYPKKGKRGGAYCWGGYNVPTLVMLNHLPTQDSVMTLAHEMGHAIHTELSKKQKPLYEDYTISVAEVASTFFENIAFEEMYNKMSEAEKITALYDRLADMIQTVFRQIACFNFEADLHKAVREKGYVSAQEIGALHNKNMAEYLGPAFKMEELDGYLFVTWSHIRSFFYVYSYAYGELISRALYKKYKQDPSFINKVIEFLEAGSSKTPEEIFKSIGIDTSNPEFFELGIQSAAEDLERLTKLMTKNKKKVK